MPNTVDPMEILKEVAPDSMYGSESDIPDIANYRDADMQGIACAFCSKFRFSGLKPDPENEAGIPVGGCMQWEANVNGAKVCDRFASGPPSLDGEGNEVWSEFSDQATVDREFFFPADEGLELSNEDGLIWKDILREGEWEVTPTLAGPVQKPLKIVADGPTDYKKGVISLSDIETAFNDDAVQYVQIPLTDEPGKDHKEMARLNQGFVKKLKRVVGADGKARLRAGMLFTEPETGEKVKRGTYADVSAKITPFLRKRDSKIFPAALRHVCITNTPWIDGMDPFGAGVAASDNEATTSVESYQLAERLDANDERLSLEWRKAKANEALQEQLGLSASYAATDIVGTNLTVRNDVAKTTWTVPYKVTSEGIELSAATQWELNEDTEESEPAQVVDTPPPAPSSTRHETRVEKARRLRGLRLSQADTTNGGSHMPRTGIEELDGLELSDDARAVFQRMQQALDKATQKDRESAADARIDELKALGFSDCPGALALYRQVAIADDEMPVIEFSDESGAKHEPSAKELLDQFIHALTGGKQIAVQLSQQADNDNANNDPPPVDDTTERPLEDRLADAKAAIGQK